MPKFMNVVIKKPLSLGQWLTKNPIPPKDADPMVQMLHNFQYQKRLIKAKQLNHPVSKKTQKVIENLKKQHKSWKDF